MSTVASRLESSGSRSALNAAAIFWFVIALAGLWLFVYYLGGQYGSAAVQGELDAWGESSLKGYVAGDTAGNLVFAAHILMAAIISFGGVLQLIPRIRARAIALHRWNGRLFIATSIAISLGGLYLIWVRDATTTTLGSIAISINAVLIMLFAAKTVQQARAGNIDSHRRWALRTFMVVNGVWFFRVGLMAWIILNQGPVGVGENLDGPFVMVLNFANYLLPLAILELYLHARDRGGPKSRIAVTATLLVLTLLMGAGIFGAFMFMWLPQVG